MELATRTFELMERWDYVDADWNVYDGAHLPNCSDINKAQFSYNAAMLMQGAAFLYNYVSLTSSYMQMKADELFRRTERRSGELESRAY